MEYCHGIAEEISATIWVFLWIIGLCSGILALTFNYETYDIRVGSISHWKMGQKSLWVEYGILIQ